MADQGVVLQARLALERDPTLTLAWLRNRRHRRAAEWDLTRSSGER